jgi:hypothetical protein
VRETRLHLLERHPRQRRPAREHAIEVDLDDHAAEVEKYRVGVFRRGIQRGVLLLEIR